MLHIGNLRFDSKARQVWGGSQEIHLTRKAFDLLAVLIEQCPGVVSKEEIHARLWPDTHVAPITLHSLVSELRRALGDEADDPRFIRTVHGLGYAFISPMEPSFDDRSQPRRLRGWLVGDRGRLSLFDGQNLLGRGVDHAIELPSSTVSRRHANIRIDHDAWLEDLGSKNGTFIGESRVTQSVRLSDGDRVRFGSLLLTFRFCHAAGATSTESASDRSSRRRPEPNR